MGGQGRGREGRRPGVHIDDDGGDEETDGKPALREIMPVTPPDDNKYIFTVSLCVLKIFRFCCFVQELNILLKSLLPGWSYLDSQSCPLPSAAQCFVISIVV